MALFSSIVHEVILSKFLKLSSLWFCRRLDALLEIMVTLIILIPSLFTSLYVNLQYVSVNSALRQLKFWTESRKLTSSVLPHVKTIRLCRKWRGQFFPADYRLDSARRYFSIHSRCCFLSERREVGGSTVHVHSVSHPPDVTRLYATLAKLGSLQIRGCQLVPSTKHTNGSRFSRHVKHLISNLVPTSFWMCIAKVRPATKQLGCRQPNVTLKTRTVRKLHPSQTFQLWEKCEELRKRVKQLEVTISRLSQASTSS